MRKHVFGYMRTVKALIRLRIRAVWSRPSLSANRIIGYYRMYGWSAKARIILCACAWWSESLHFVRARMHFLLDAVQLTCDSKYANQLHVTDCAIPNKGQYLTLSTLGNILSRRHLKYFSYFFFFFAVIRIWHFMQIVIVSIGVNLHELSRSVFWGKNKKMPSNCRLLN